MRPRSSTSALLEAAAGANRATGTRGFSILSVVSGSCAQMPFIPCEGQFRPLSDVRQGETTPPVAKAFTMSVASADALDATQCTWNIPLGVHQQRPECVAAAMRTPFAGTPRSLRLEKRKLKLP